MNEMRPVGAPPLWAGTELGSIVSNKKPVKIAAKIRISFSVADPWNRRSPCQRHTTPSQAMSLRPKDSLAQKEQQQNWTGHDDGAGHQQGPVDGIHLLQELHT